MTTTQGVQHVNRNPLGLNFGGSWIAAALVAVLAPVYIFYGSESPATSPSRPASRSSPAAAPCRPPAAG